MSSHVLFVLFPQGSRPKYKCSHGLGITGNSVRLAIKAPADVNIKRSELKDRETTTIIQE